jgi:hypothetical protein
MRDFSQCKRYLYVNKYFIDMDNEKLFAYRKKFAENAKADKFVRSYYKSHGSMPTSNEVNVARVLTAEEVAAVEFSVQVSALVEEGSVEPTPVEEVAEWEYIWNEETWNASYANGTLKDYYVWADGLSPYKEDLWNTVENRPANWNDIEKDENGNPIEYEDGYHYANCVRCWQGAVNAPGAAYPWCGVKITPFNGAIKLEYGDAVAYPWGEYREFTRTFAIASIPTTFGEEYKLDGEGKTTFDPSGLVATLIKK